MNSVKIYNWARHTATVEHHGLTLNLFRFVLFFMSMITQLLAMWHWRWMMQMLLQQENSTASCNHWQKASCDKFHVALAYQWKETITCLWKGNWRAYRHDYLKDATHHLENLHCSNTPRLQWAFVTHSYPTGPGGSGVSGGRIWPFRRQGLTRVRCQLNPAFVRKLACQRKWDHHTFL